MRNRILKEIAIIKDYLKDLEEDLEDFTSLKYLDEDAHYYVLTQIDKYTDYKVALEQAIKAFPFETGSY